MKKICKLFSIFLFAFVTIVFIKSGSITSFAATSGTTHDCTWTLDGTVLTGSIVTNVLIDEKLICDNDNFEKLVDLFQTYFLNGGTHFQLTYVSKENLINVKKTPEDYKNLRVRVSGFSDYFIFLNDALQDEIITRTVKEG